MDCITPSRYIRANLLAGGQKIAQLRMYFDTSTSPKARRGIHMTSILRKNRTASLIFFYSSHLSKLHRSECAIVNVSITFQTVIRCDQLNF